MEIPKLNLRWMVAGLVTLTGLCYVNSLDNSFHYDDSHSIVENYYIRHLGNIPRFFTDPQTFSREPAMAMYRPLVVTTYAANYALGHYETRGYHLFNVFVHALAALIAFAILRQVLGDAKRAWWGSAFFALHPIQSQAVNYISSRAELLGALGVLAAFYLTFVKSEHWRWALLAYGLALLSKSTAVVLLPLMTLGELRRQPELRNWGRHLFFWLLTGVYLALIMANGFLSKSLAQDVRPYGTQIYTQLKALVYYIKLLIMPVGLSVEHHFSVSERLGEGAVLAACAFVASLAYLTWRGWQKRHGSALGSGWFFAGLGLTFFVPLNVLVNEHRLYLAALGGIGLAVWGFHRYKASLLLRLCSLGLLLVFGVMTVQRNAVWQDEKTLWREAVRVAPKMFRVQSNLGLAYYEGGALDSALVAFKRAIELNAKYSKTWNNLGLVYEDLGQYERAEAAYIKALELRSDLAGTYGNLGRLLARRGNAERAAEYLEEARRLDPYNVEVLVNRGLVYQRSGREDDAERMYRAALAIRPDYAEGYNNLGLLYADRGETQRALGALERAVQLKPDYAAAQINLQVQQSRAAGEPPHAVYLKLLRQYPQRAELWQGLTSAYAAAGRINDAIEACRKILELDPGNVRARENLQKLLAARGTSE